MTFNWSSLDRVDRSEVPGFLLRLAVVISPGFSQIVTH